jgi:hypothetical protein
LQKYNSAYRTLLREGEAFCNKCATKHSRWKINHKKFHVLCKNCANKKSRDRRKLDKFKSMIRDSKSRAKIRNIDHSITKEDLVSVFEKQNKQCAVSGLDLTFENVSLDRINSSLGYTINNIQLVHYNINCMKLDTNSEIFIKMCKLVAAYNDKA